MREEIEKILDDFDTACPECHDEGHGGDGCSYCWEHNVAQEGLSKTVQAFQTLITKAQSEVLQAVRDAAPKDCDEIGGKECNNHLGCYECGGCEPSNHRNRQWRTAINTVAKERGLE